MEGASSLNTGVLIVESASCGVRQRDETISWCVNMTGTLKV